MKIFILGVRDRASLVNVSSETNRCNNVMNIFISLITSTCFGLYYAHHQDTNPKDPSHSSSRPQAAQPGNSA
jgi:hypothetical protein